jgi:hypothetical protein
LFVEHLRLYVLMIDDLPVLIGLPIFATI